jgi:hypothetical protein
MICNSLDHSEHEFGERRLSFGISSKIKELPGGCLSFFEPLRWGSIIFRRDYIGGYCRNSTSGLLLTLHILKIIFKN